MKTQIDNLVWEFAEAVVGQYEAIAAGNVVAGNRFARQYIDAFRRLCAMGDIGRDALASLFNDPREKVRVEAAVFLLRHKTAEATSILERAAKGIGLQALGAAQTLTNWKNGTWNLDPPSDTPA